MAQHARPPSTVELNQDVKRMVVDHVQSSQQDASLYVLIFGQISLSSDLHALCLVSQAWNAAAVQCLYTDINLNTCFNSDHVLLFRKCLRLGASKNLKYARRLSLLDVSNIDRTSTSQFASRRNRILHSILQMFPDNVLRVFRYLAEDNLSAKILRRINKHQKLVHTIHVMRCDASKVVARPRRNILVDFHDHDHKTVKFVEFLHTSPQFESLAILFSGGWLYETAMYWEENFDILSLKKLSTKELYISGNMPQAFSTAVVQVFDYSMVTKLVFFDCNLWPFDDVLRMPELCNVKYFQLCTFDNVDIASLKLFFERNRMLQHVYLNLLELSAFPMEPQNLRGDTLYLRPLHGRLKTLSLHEIAWELLRDYDDPMRIDFMPHSVLEHICRESRTLQQIGLQPPMQVFTSAERLLAYLKPLQLLKDLRIVQLYHSRLSMVEVLQARTEDEVAEHVRQAATRVFQDMHLHCSSLRVLIWGIHGEPEPVEVEASSDEAEDEGLTIERTAQHLFVRRIQELPNGDSLVTAVPATRFQLQDEFPDLGMLDYDPGQQTMERIRHFPLDS